MDKTRNRKELPDAARRTDTVRLSVAGQVIDVSWEDLLDPNKWFSGETVENPTQK